MPLSKKEVKLAGQILEQIEELKIIVSSNNSIDKFPALIAQLDADQKEQLFDRVKSLFVTRLTRLEQKYNNIVDPPKKGAGNRR